MCTLFEGEGLRKYVLYTHLNVDNYGCPLTTLYKDEKSS